MSDYQIDGKPGLKQLLREVDKLNIRFRISSLECNVVDDELLDILSNSKNFCPHFHLSLQSACNETLKRMNRHYSIEQFKEIVNEIRQKFSNPTISTDIIVGFKGETDEEFETTLNNLKEIKFDFMHIFPYSVRSGTVASKIKGDVDKSVVKQREKELEKLNITFKTNLYSRNKNTSHTLLVEAVENGYSLGYTEKYIYTYLKGEYSIGSIQKINLVEPYLDGMIANLKEEKLWYW